MQEKFTCDDEMWSAAMSKAWTKKAPRPDGRQFSRGFSGLLPSDLRLAPRRELAEGRAQELKQALRGVEGRVSARDMEVWHRRVTTLVNIAPNEVRTEAPQHGGRFACENDGVADTDSDSDPDKELEVPQRIIYDTVSEQRRQCAQRSGMGTPKMSLP